MKNHKSSKTTLGSSIWLGKAGGILLLSMLSPNLSFGVSAIAAPSKTIQTTQFKPVAKINKDQNSLGMKYAIKSINKIYRNGKIYNNTKHPGENDSFCISHYPVFFGHKSALQINQIVGAYIADCFRFGESQSKSNSVEELSTQFLKGYDAFKKENATELPYQFDLTGTILLNRPNIMTLAILTNAYTGGAHGMSHTEYLVFNTESGRLLKLNDIFVRGFESRLNTLIDARFRRMKGLSKTDRLDGEKGTLFKNVIQLNQNFALTDKGVNFFYNEYEIAAYCFGPTIVNLSYSELASILKRDYYLR